ncbi:MAG TPA: hypothetical protein VJ718_10360 [Candidatus Binataceae bacterium]|nr:hypothetical protein [Candidatus Binataceae bacterium]
MATYAALIAAGMLIEPEMLGGALLGAGIVYGLPVIGKILRPVLQTAVTMGYSAAVGVTGAVNEASQELRQMLAEARSYRERHERAGAPEQSG